MTLQTENKDRLEILLDDFTDVHGTVLLGMHKELLSLKQDLDDRLESGICKALAPINAADSELRAQVEAAQRIIATLDEKSRLAVAAIAAAREQLTRDIAAARAAMAADCARVSEEVSGHKNVLQGLEKRFLDAFEAKQGEAQTQLAASHTEFQLVLAQIGNQRSNFEQEIAQAMTRIAALQQEHQGKMSATLKVTDKLNSDSRALLRALRKRIEALQQHELTLQKQRRLEIVVVGLVSLGTLAVWIWQSLPH